MNTKWLLTLVVLCAMLSTISSATALFFVMRERTNYQQFHERINAIEAGSLKPTQTVRSQDSQAEELSTSHSAILKGLSENIQSLSDSVRELSDRMSPIERPN